MRYLVLAFIAIANAENLTECTLNCDRIYYEYRTTAFECATLLYYNCIEKCLALYS